MLRKSRGYDFTITKSDDFINISYYNLEFATSNNSICPFSIEAHFQVT